MNEFDDYDEDSIEIHHEDTIEVVGDSEHPMKRTFQRDFEESGIIKKKTIIQHRQLTCGHLNKPAGVICACGKTSFCEICADKLRQVICSECFHFVFKCCCKGNDLEELYCPTCWKKLSIFKRISLSWG